MATYALYMLTTSGLPALDEAAEQLQVNVEDLDPQFGVVPIQPLEDGMWRVAFRADERLDLVLQTHEGVEGPFADPPIEPADPVDPPA